MDDQQSNLWYSWIDSSWITYVNVCGQYYTCWPTEGNCIVCETRPKYVFELMYGFYVAFVYETHTMGCIMNCANRFLDHFNVFITDIITDFIEQELLYTYLIFINQTVSSCWWFGKPWCSCDVTVMFSMNPSESWISLKYKFLSYFKNAWRRFRDNPLSIMVYLMQVHIQYSAMNS